MKAIMLMFDSLNRAMLSPYGCEWTKTPNFERLAQRSVQFSHCYVGSVPCMPARRELHTGRYNFLHRSWGPLEPFDESMPQILSKNGIYTHLISDHHHYWEEGGANYHARYNSWEIVRGQERDHWKSYMEKPEEGTYLGNNLPCFAASRKYLESKGRHTQNEVFELGFEFLDSNIEKDNWFLQIECFDPHEPFYSSPEYEALYPHDYLGPEFIWPKYGAVQESPKEVEHLKYEYAALLSMCDTNLGRLLDYMDEHGMWEDTMLIVNTDHGFLLGEHDDYGKCCVPFYEEVAHTPLFIWDPRFGTQGEKREALVQTIDIAPTLLEYFHAPKLQHAQGKSLSEVIHSDKPVRKYALFGLHGGHVNITDGRYVYMRGTNETNSPLNEYTLMPAHINEPFRREELISAELCPSFSFTDGVPVLKMVSNRNAADRRGVHTSYPSVLYDVSIDPQQKQEIRDEEVENRMIEALCLLMRETEAPKEQYKRLQLDKFI